ncbi:MAG: prolyl oligopeptidase family serine peptidase, partial [Pseudomonadota bacterium]
MEKKEAWPTFSSNALAPVAQVSPKLLVKHGRERIDPYYWLRDKEAPEVLAYLEAENEYTDQVMAPTESLQQKLVSEMRGRILEKDSTAPYRHGAFFYYDRYEDGQEYPVYCRADESQTEQVLLDINRLAEDHDYFDVGGFEVSPNHRYAAFAFDTTGRRIFELAVLDLESKLFTQHKIEGIASCFAWANDSDTLFYVKQDELTLRWHQIHRYRMSDRSSELVYEESDETYEVGLDVSLSERFIYVQSQSTLTSEVRVIPADGPDDEPFVFLSRQTGHEYYVTDGDDRFFVLTNHQAENFRLMEVPLHNTGMDHWRELVPHRVEVLLEDVEVFEKYFVLTEKEQGRSQMRVFERASMKSHLIPFSETVFSAECGDNFEYAAEVVRIDFESMTTPETVFDYDMGQGHMGQGNLSLVKQDVVLGGYDPEDYASEYIYATATDGTRIPVSVVYRKSCRQEGGNPTLQYGYGAYGIPMEAEFDSNLLSLLDRGIVFAVAHVRGGADLGRSWYYEGRQLKKKNTFSDFIACSEYLVESGITAKGQLYASGGSAGGLLIGAVVNMAPELY